jgi:hypothetical protein
MAAPRIAAQARPQRKHEMVPYHQGIQRGARKADGKILIQERHGAPIVELCFLLAYQKAANGGGRILRSSFCTPG